MEDYLDDFSQKSDFEKLVICRKFVEVLRKDNTSLRHEIGIFEAEVQELKDENKKLNALLREKGIQVTLENLQEHQIKLNEALRKIKDYEEKLKSQQELIEMLEREKRLFETPEEIPVLLKENEMLKLEIKGLERKQPFSTKKQLQKDAYVKALLENVRGLQKANTSLHNEVKKYRDILFTQKYNNDNNNNTKTT